MLERLQAANNILSVNAISETKDPTRPTTSDSDAFLTDEINAMVSKQNHGLIYLDSGAGRTVLNDLILLVDPTPVKKKIHTLSTLVKVAHQGTLDFKGIKLYPVYYVPNGPVNLLKHSLIEPEIDLHRIVPFGIRITTKIVNPTSKIVPRGEVLRELTFERSSDGLRLLNLETGRIRVSQDYKPAVNAVMPTTHQPSSALPIRQSLKIKLQVPASLSNIPEETNDSYKPANPPEPASVVPTTEKLQNYDYIRYYKEAPRHISSSISQDNIVEGKRNACHSDQLLLTDTVPYLQAVNDPIERTEWRKAMDAEFASLMCHNTGELVPYREKPTKVIGGMWRLTCKRSEKGEVY
ncbi:hypothetical protein O181_014929 [Austropuccinia psidii MF-1]|uniref:Uncharacterized protein n=1 Tax=Austropuccinia psidii MF-1 TaxID=1389203 RepID=A0A9Q3BZ16_9BASI|nr:hypothetical protein [Austropuccinia psidii MF-1]